jgi:hypothetical protein
MQDISGYLWLSSILFFISAAIPYQMIIQIIYHLKGFKYLLDLDF